MSAGLDVKRSSWSGYENGTAEPPFELLLKVSEYFKVSIDKLLKVDLTVLSESQLGILERGGDVDISGRQLRVLATTVDAQDRENVELVPEKAKAGYTTGYVRLCSGKIAGFTGKSLCAFFACLAVAQWIVHMPPKRGIQVRTLLGGPNFCTSNYQLTKSDNHPLPLMKLGIFYLRCKKQIKISPD